MKKAIWTVIIILIIAIGVLWYYSYYAVSQDTTTSLVPTSTAQTTTPPAQIPTFDQSISDGTISLKFPSADFGLATNPTQILVHPNTPPCDTGFNYCLYYIGSAYNGTNFESAGIRIEKRPTLTTQTKCLTTLPTGYTGITPTIATSTDYAVSVFSPIDGAAAGHFATGALYRLFYKGACYEFETRIGQSDFGNYPSGTIQQFTSADESTLQTEIQSILGTLTVSNGEPVSFPQVSQGQ